MKIYLKNNDAENALELLHTALAKEENGDLYYCLAMVFKFIGDSEEYYNGLKSALANPFTLSYSKKAVKAELDYLGAKIGRHEEIEPQKTVEEYHEEETNANEKISENNEESYEEIDDPEDYEEEPYDEENEYEEYGDTDESDESDEDEDDYQDEYDDEEYEEYDESEDDNDEE